ncbi:MAG: transglycosylase domain-containing protein [Actinomycetota bacterium]
MSETSPSSDRALQLTKGGVLILLRTGGLFAGLLVGFLILGWVASMLLAPAGEGLANSVGFGVQVPQEVELAGLDQTSTVYAADGSVIAVLHDEVDRTIVTLDEIPPHVQNAVLAAEDRRFYEHDGFDVEGFGRALLENLRTRDVSQGGSTITQQLAKSEVGDDISLQRKLTEVAFAMALERELTKEEILERYLNQVYFGGGAYGIAAAAEEYFAKTVGELTAGEAATLAGQIRSPGATDPRRFPDIALRRRDATLRAMVQEGWLPPEQLESELNVPLQIAPRIIEQPSDPFIAEAVKQEFYTLEEFGDSRLERNEVLLNGGLNVYTSFDPRLQRIAEEVVLSYFPDPTPTAALSSVDPRTGQIRAIFGGSDFDREQYNFATQGRRQPGSGWKPLVMATALEIGFSPSMTLPGASPTRFETGDEWEDRGVKNFGNASYGPITMRRALVSSVNTAFDQLMLIVGTENVVNLANQLGIDTNAALRDPVTGQVIINPSIALGGLTNGVTTLEMAGAFAAFANAGAWIEPSLIDRVEDQQGNVLYARPTVPTQIFDPVVNEIMVDTMQQVVCCGTAGRANIANLGWRAGGKTGTSQSNADAWFTGYTPVLSTSVWVGHPEGRIAMSGVSSGRQPSQIWHDFMVQALEGVEPIEFPTEPPGGYEREVQEGDVEVPDVRTLQEFDAYRELADVGLSARTTEVDSERPAGQVVWQQPRGGSVVPAGEQITIGISTGSVPPPPPPATPTDQPTAVPEPEPEPPTGPTDNPNPQEPLPGPPDNPQGRPTTDPAPPPPPPPPAPPPAPAPPPPEPAPEPEPAPPPEEEEPPPPPDPAVGRPGGG